MEKEEAKKYLAKKFSEFMSSKGTNSKKLQLLDQYDGACNFAVEMGVLTRPEVDQIKTEHYS